MLAGMSEVEPCVQMPVLKWSELGVSELLPSGTVTLLLADVEGSTRLWETRPEVMAAAVALLDSVLSEVIANHDGVRPVEQGEGDSFVVAFARASDAVACALELQLAPLAPMRLRIGVHTGEIRLRDDANYIGPTINRTARLRDLAHGGQTVLSGVTEALVVDGLPADAWLTDLGTHRLRDVPRPERVVQLCHPDLANEFPPLRVSTAVASVRLPVQLTSFVGRDAELTRMQQLLAENRLVTLTGAGGVGKTRLAVQVAAGMAGEFGEGVWLVDLAPITDPELVSVAVARALGLTDQPGRSTMDTLTRFIGDRRILVVLDNCEHLLNASAALIIALLGACPRLTLLATSREPIGAPGEVSWRVPSLSLADEAIELFTDRARHARPDFAVTNANAATVGEICQRLDGMPLAIELAAARVRALSLAEILDSLHDRFRLLTGGARTAVRRQQTLRASVDWSHALLTEPERVLLRRLAVFVGGFDLEAARVVAAGGEVHGYQVFDQLTLLVDKSLVVAEDSGDRTRYRLLETVRQYAAEKLGESGEADAVRTRHRDHYTAMAAPLDSPPDDGYERLIAQAVVEMDNLRAAFAWSNENSDTEVAMQLASSLWPLWAKRGRGREGLAWFDVVLTAEHGHHGEVTAAVRARALADKAVIDAALMGDYRSKDKAEQALAIARELDDQALLVRSLYACCVMNAPTPESARPYFVEAIALARARGDRWMLSRILVSQAYAAAMAGDPIGARAAAEEGRDVADAIGDWLESGRCRAWLGFIQMMQGDLAGAVGQFGDALTRAEAAHDLIYVVLALTGQALALAHQGEINAAPSAADAAIAAAAELGGLAESAACAALAIAAFAAGDVPTARCVAETIVQHGITQAPTAVECLAQVALVGNHLIAARDWAEEAVSTTTGWWHMLALTTRARVAIARGEPEQAGRDLHDALLCGADIQARTGIADILESLADITGDAGSHREAARLYGAAHGIRERIGEVRFKIWDAGYEASMAVVRNALGEKDFPAAWDEGAALTTEETIAYAQRGRGERHRPASGWASLTPTERDVVRLVSAGLGNKDIATRLFVSPRTVQTHLTHVYAKLGLTSRVQLAQEAARHA
jgi:predicted ATPase/class 3 adenylate cyclase/DNA-binding CsgD family transcriptional regulator